MGRKRLLKQIARKSSHFSSNISAPLQTNLHTTLVARCTLAPSSQVREEVSDIIPRMPIQSSAQSLLVQMMRNQTDATAKHEKTVEHTHVQVVFSLFWGECTAVAKEIHEANGDAAVHVEDQVVLLGGGNGLDSDGIVEELAAREVLLDVFLDELNTEIGVLSGLDTVADTWD